jgi:hypothetical protein
MKKPGQFKRWWIFANILGLGLFIYFWRQKPAPGFPVRYTAQDGTRFIFNDLESKTNIPNEELSFYEDVLGSLPKSWQTQVSFPPTWNIAFDEPALVLSYEQNLSGPKADQRYGFRMLDENEDEMEEVGHKLWTTVPKSHDASHPLVYSDFLRRSKTFKLQVLEHSDLTNKVIKEIIFENRTPFKGAPFPALPLPQRQTNGPLSVVMEDALWIPNSGSADAVSGIRSAGFSVLRFSVAYDGQQTTNWSIMGVFSKTADGRGDGGMRTGLWANGKYYFTIKKAIRPTEPMSYRVLVQQTHWETNEVWNTPQLPLASVGAFNSLSLTNRLQGQTILLKGISGRRSSPPWRASKTREASIDLETSTMPDFTRVVALEMQDSDGKSLHFNPQYFEGSGQNSGPRNHPAYEIDFSNNVNAVTLKIAIRKTLWLNFSAQPRVTTTHDPALPK